MGVRPFPILRHARVNDAWDDVDDYLDLVIPSPRLVSIYGAEHVAIPTKLNNIPHTHDIRNFFYAEVTEACKRALSAGKQRMILRQAMPLGKL